MVLSYITNKLSGLNKLFNIAINKLGLNSIKNLIILLWEQMSYQAYSNPSSGENITELLKNLERLKKAFPMLTA